MPDQHKEFELRIYIAGRAPHSSLALANLSVIMERVGRDLFAVEIIDVLEEPERAIQDGIFVTPVLFKVSPPPQTKIFGSLNDVDKVIHALGVLGGRN